VRRIRRAGLFALLALGVLYTGDYLSACYRLPGNRTTLGSVEVQTLWAIRQKDGRIAYVPGDSGPQTCLRSLFPHLGYTPCWYLRGHARKLITVGRAGPGAAIVLSVTLQPE
jgi:hypothetical protein